ncbi:hypothetical protein E2C01_049315 [Portunus trituberculatus]|uniref:Uncharacterized protein n=1 Tax=Portunus trituberculatus TaxID=210409 RepID=A0A5B7G629_PORTR|nr:hypothetical protein [Portunus trituberculatus]
MGSWIESHQVLRHHLPSETILSAEGHQEQSKSPVLCSRESVAAFHAVFLALLSENRESEQVIPSHISPGPIYTCFQARQMCKYKLGCSNFFLAASGTVQEGNTYSVSAQWGGVWSPALLPRTDADDAAEAAAITKTSSSSTTTTTTTTTTPTAT